jgi:hypothetical protein
MYFQEDIEVRGTVSPRLAYHLEEYQYLLKFRFPENIHQVEIDYEKLKAMETIPSGVGTTFSGGIDSTFTLWKHLPQNQPDRGFQVTHGVFTKGFDILHREKDNYLWLYHRYQQHLTDLSIDLIPLETNIFSIIHHRLSIYQFYGPLVVCMGLSLAELFQRFYIPSSGDYDYLEKVSYTSDPFADRLLSTDTLQVIHHGSTHRRVEKVEELADWDIPQNLLWVCIRDKREKESWNCSRCEKCVRTMIALYALGKMDQYKTFAKPFKTNRDILWWIRKFSLNHEYNQEIFSFSKKHNKNLLPWLILSAFFGSIRHGVIKFMPSFVKKWLRQFGYFVLRDEAVDAYELHEVTHLIQENRDYSST